jgi:hypothetical protein
MGGGNVAGPGSIRTRHPTSDQTASPHNVRAADRGTFLGIYSLVRTYIARVQLKHRKPQIMPENLTSTPSLQSNPAAFRKTEATPGITSFGKPATTQL